MDPNGTTDANENPTGERYTSSSVPSSPSTDRIRLFRRFMGPGWLIGVGYIDPGNWQTGLEAGSKYRYGLLNIVLLANAIAMVLQHLAIRLAIATGNDLATACRVYYKHKSIVYILYLFAEMAMIATDMAELIGGAIALKLLFNLPFMVGICILSLDALLLLGGVHHPRALECLIVGVMSFIGGCFVLEVSLAAPRDWRDILRGFLPDMAIGLFVHETQALFLGLGILGATVMPHNLYLHSFLVKPTNRPHIADIGGDGTTSDRKEDDIMDDSDVECDEEHEACNDVNVVSPSFPPEPPKPTESTSLLRQGRTEPVFSTVPIPSTQQLVARIMSPTDMIRYSTWDSTIALSFAFTINAMILITAAAGLYDHNVTTVTSIEEAVRLLGKILGDGASVVFGVALLASGQSSTVTGTLAGQVVFDGFLQIPLRVKPWQRRLFTRLITVLPTLFIVGSFGESVVSTMLLYSQVGLSLQLPFAVIPLVQFTTDPNIMGQSLVAPLWLRWISVAIIVVLTVMNIALIVVAFIDF